MKKLVSSLVVLASLLIGCQANQQSVSDSSSTQSAESSVTKSYPKMRDVILKTPTGERVLLSDFQGKNIYINIWATWCGPCKYEIPEIEEVYQEYKDNEDYVFLSVTSPTDSQFKNNNAYDVEAAEIVTYAEEIGMTYPILFDYQDQFTQTYVIRSFPSHIFINREGEIVGQYTGAISQEILRQELDKL